MGHHDNHQKWVNFSKKGYGFGKKGFDKAWNAVDKLGTPVNRLSNRIGCEAFWPMTLDKESDKAARILRSFCKDGFYTEDLAKDTDQPRGKQRALKKVPARVIKNAKGLCIFTTMRSGLWVSGAGGSGVLIGRIPETGEWSPPSGVMLHTAGLGFLAGIDIYDCVVVINNYEALKAFKTVRCTLGGEISATAGPIGVGGVLDSEVHKRQHPIWTYMKSKGLYGGAQIDGTIIVERTDENERFYGARYSVNEILGGKVRQPPPEVRGLLGTVKAAQGDHGNFFAIGESPSDMQPIPPAANNFGIPAVDDPDPYGVKALEAEGLYIRDAGTQERPTREAFEFKPSSTSPVLSRGSWRTSVTSHASRTSTSADRGVQTESRTRGSTAPSPRSVTANNSPLDSEVSNGKVASSSPVTSPLAHTMVQMDNEEEDNKSDIDDDDEDELDDDVQVHDASMATNEKVLTIDPHNQMPSIDSNTSLPSPTFSRAKLVTIPKLPLPQPPSNRPVPPPPPPPPENRPVPPPPLPARNPHRHSPVVSGQQNGYADNEALHNILEMSQYLSSTERDDDSVKPVKLPVSPYLADVEALELEQEGEEHDGRVAEDAGTREEDVEKAEEFDKMEDVEGERAEDVGGAEDDDDKADVEEATGKIDGSMKPVDLSVEDEPVTDLENEHGLAANGSAELEKRSSPSTSEMEEPHEPDVNGHQHENGGSDVEVQGGEEKDIIAAKSVKPSISSEEQSEPIHLPGAFDDEELHGLPGSFAYDMSLTK